MEQMQLPLELLYPSCPTMDPQLVEVLTDLCFQKEEQLVSDLLFVFGSNIKHKEIAGIITELMDNNKVDQVLITGGVASFGNSFPQNRPESEAIFALLPERHKQQPIILETRSRNMLENIIEAQKMVAAEKIKTISFICHAYASKRAALTLKSFFPNASIHCISIALPSYQVEHPITAAYWSKTKYGQSLILGEYLRLITYGNRGDFPLTAIQPYIDLVERLLLNK